MSLVVSSKSTEDTIADYFARESIDLIVMAPSVKVGGKNRCSDLLLPM
jgi:hypothetical protein